jgi:hypothetical protein
MTMIAYAFLQSRRLNGAEAVNIGNRGRRHASRVSPASAAGVWGGALRRFGVYAASAMPQEF